jgi:hypothetical protein
LPRRLLQHRVAVHYTMVPIWLTALLVGWAPLVASPPIVNSVPLLFERAGSQFISRTYGGSLAVDASGASFCGSRLRFLGGDAGAEAQPESAVSYINEYIGADPSNWRTHVPAVSRVRYKNVYPGIDVLYYSRQGRLEYDFVLAPGADPRRIRLSFEHVDKFAVDGEGNAVIGTDRAAAALAPPLVYQEQNSRRFSVPARYVKRGPQTLGIAVGKYDRGWPLVIDPVLYATYLGGSGADSFNDIKLDPSGNMVLVGSTNSADFPNAAGAANGQDAVVVKLNALGTAIVFVTLIGGSGTDSASKAAVDSTGAVYVLGSSGSSDFPYTSGAYRATTSAAQGTFIAKLNATGQLVYSAQVQAVPVPGTVQDSVNTIAVDGAGRAIYAGITVNTALPVTAGAFQTVYGGGYSDGFIGALNPGGSGLAFLTYLGGNFDDAIAALAVDSSGAIVAAGQSSISVEPPDSVSGNTEPCANVAKTFPITSGAYRSAFSCNLSYAFQNHSEYSYTYTDSFLVNLNASGNALIFSTYAPDAGNFGIASLVLDGGDNVYLGGVALGSRSCFSCEVSSFSGSGFVAKMNSSGSSLLYSTSFGSYSNASSNSLGLNALALDLSGGLIVTGPTSFLDFPNDTNPASVASPYVMHFDARGQPLGSNLFTVQSVGGVAVDAANVIVLAGTATAGQLTTSSGSLQASGVGGTDGFIERLTLANSAGAPATVTATQGSGQRTVINTAFLEGLQATVQDASGNPVPGISVTFAAPGSGASGSFAGPATVQTNASGVATTPALTANGTTGSYSVIASAAGVSGPASFTLTNTLLSCNIKGYGTTNVVDVQTMINEALGVTLAANDLNRDGVVNVVDVQIVINPALGLGCAAE